ncbi:uncharacterized protein LOC110912334 isoform X1 [Helianthus annuus]|nr:uncharacterized protein LOC110912334 isoform X1 [Helianthus annuus]
MHEPRTSTIKVFLTSRRPFLVTAKAMVDMSDGKLTFRVVEKEIKFEVGQRAEDDPVKYLKAIDSSLDDALQGYNSGCESSRLGIKHAQKRMMDDEKWIPSI